MSNEYYVESGTPTTSSRLASSAIRAEFVSIRGGFDKLPLLLGNGLTPIRVNAGGTALEVATATGTGDFVYSTSPTLVTPVLGVASATSINKVTITAPATGATLTLANGSTFVTAGAFSVTFTATATTALTLPTTGTLSTLAGSETFTNKTLTTPTINGAALSGTFSGNPTFSGTVLAPGHVVQVVETVETSGVLSTTSSIPIDDTIPQNTEGTEFYTVSMTPKSATSTLYIDVGGYWTNSGAAANIVALFQDSTANALAAASNYLAVADASQTYHLQHKMTSGTTSSTTFKVRLGTSGGTLRINANSSNRLFGGVANSYIRVTEVI